MITVDVSDFEKKFNEITKNTLPSLLGEGLFQAGAMLLKDAIMASPRAPHKKGALWRSQQIEKPIVGFGTDIQVTAGFNIEYAHRLHEAPDGWRWTLPGSGPKFLSTALVNNRDLYMKHVAGYCQSQGGG